MDNLRNTLLDKLISVRDMSVLEKINDLIGNIDLNNTIFKLTEPQRQMLMESERDIQMGNFISDEALNAEEDQWLNG